MKMTMIVIAKHLIRTCSLADNVGDSDDNDDDDDDNDDDDDDGDYSKAPPQVLQ